MAENKKTLRMTFAAADGSSMSISLDNPKAGLTNTEIEGVMDTLIGKNIFQSAGGNLVAKKDAKIVDTTTSDLYDPE
ncbi:DUF2922 domain-containing protein [Candidatus Formimonas warabiya]|uniref:DUF2922 domain-containing protein n=1 Tax=Formimonas warabiya TaxID=1761012 RepID=A0A3G1KQ06_FORW1|nr:DUF2922 domain-containing protein [Candidatus Formimonas warabiya]ATW24517.1 hypothetical protein DCMF_06745 [Candidatus Formimonas warabiya]